MIYCYYISSFDAGKELKREGKIILEPGALPWESGERSTEYGPQEDSRMPPSPQGDEMNPGSEC